MGILMGPLTEVGDERVAVTDGSKETPAPGVFGIVNTTPHERLGRVPDVVRTSQLIAREGVISDCTSGAGTLLAFQNGFHVPSAVEDPKDFDRPLSGVVNDEVGTHRPKAHRKIG